MTKRKMNKKDIATQIESLSSRLWGIEKKFMVEEMYCKGLNIHEFYRVCDPYFKGYHVDLDDICECITQLLEHLNLRVNRKEFPDCTRCKEQGTLYITKDKK